MSTGRDIPADYDERAVNVSERKDEAAGAKAVLVTMQRALEQMGPVRTWPPWHGSTNATASTVRGGARARGTDNRKLAEFCENGAKAVAEEATKRRLTPEFFARHSVAELAAKPEYWLSQQGAAHSPDGPSPPDAQHYTPRSRGTTPTG